MSVADEAPFVKAGSAQPDDLVLLSRYADAGDAEAFQTLVLRYQNLVWSACRRILRNSSDAEDAVQNVFLAMAKSAASIESNLAAWLHRTAVNRSTSLVRSTVARRKREQQHVENLDTEQDERAWKEMRDVIDVCLAELSEEDRELVIEHFYRGMTQLEIGRRRGIGQQAVAVRLKKAIDHLRRALRTRGLTVSAAVIAGALKAGLAEASAPAHLTAALAKIGISGVGIKTSAATGLSIATKAAIAIVPLALCLFIAKWLFFGHIGPPFSNILAQVDAARSIQYTKTRTNSANGQTDEIQPTDVLDTSIQRYRVRDGYLERVDDLAKDGTITRAMMANYRTGKILMLDMRTKTYTTNVMLKRQLPNAPNPAALLKLAPQTELAEYLANFTSGAVKTFITQNSDGKDLAGYRAESIVQNSVWRHTLWVDPISKLPVRSIDTFRNKQPGVGASDWVYDNFAFDTDLPEPLFSTSPPAGFSIKNMAKKGIQGIPIP